MQKTRGCCVDGGCGFETTGRWDLVEVELGLPWRLETVNGVWKRKTANGGRGRELKGARIPQVIIRRATKATSRLSLSHYVA